MYDFVSLITAGEKLPSLAFGFKPFDTTVLKHYPPVPECVKLAVGCGIYSVIRIFVFLGHSNAVPNCQSVQSFQRTALNRSGRAVDKL